MTRWTRVLAAACGALCAVAAAVSSARAASQDAAAPALAGGLREARAELQSRGESARHELAAQLVETALASPDWLAAPEVERAEFWFAVGVARGAATDYEPAARAAHAARGLSGSSELGLASAYNAGTFRLLRAEQLRLEIPQVREALKLPPAAPTAAQLSAPPAAEPPADPLATAREAYLLARAELVERWRSTPEDLDTRANLELAARRLRELAEYEREREEQKSEPNEREDPDQKQQESDSEGKSDPDQPPEDDKSRQDPPQDPSQDPAQEPKPDPEQESPPDPSEESEAPQPPEQAPEPGEEQDDSKPRQQDPPQPPEDERLLTPEEIQRLLQQLDKIEEQAAQVQAALRRARRVPVKKDW